MQCTGDSQHDVGSLYGGVDLAVVEREVDTHVRMLLVETRDQRSEERNAKRDGRVDAQRAAWFGVLRARRGLGLLEVVEDASTALEELRADRRRFHGARRAVQQRGPEIVLEPLDVFRDRSR